MGARWLSKITILELDLIPGFCTWSIPLSKHPLTVAHLQVFGCGAYVFLPEDICTNNLTFRSELMTFICLSEETKGYIFMKSPNNIVFTTIQALFDETLFPKCPNMHQPGFTPVGITLIDLQGEHNIPPDNENEDHGGGLPSILYQPLAVAPQPPVQYYPPQPPASLTHGWTPSPKEQCHLCGMLLYLMMMTCICLGP